MCEKRSSIYIAVKTSTLQRSRWSVAGAASISSITASVLNDVHLSLKAPSAAGIYAPESVAVTLDCVNYTRSKQHCNITRLRYHIQPTLSSTYWEMSEEGRSTVRQVLQTSTQYLVIIDHSSYLPLWPSFVFVPTMPDEFCFRAVRVCVRDTDYPVY